MYCFMVKFLVFWLRVLVWFFWQKKCRYRWERHYWRRAWCYRGLKDDRSYSFWKTWDSQTTSIFNCSCNSWFKNGVRGSSLHQVLSLGFLVTGLTVYQWFHSYVENGDAVKPTETGDIMRVACGIWQCMKWAPNEVSQGVEPKSEGS